MQYRLHYTLSLSRQYRLQNTLKSPVKQDQTGYTTIIACPGNTDYNMLFYYLPITNHSGAGRGGLMVNLKHLPSHLVFRSQRYCSIEWFAGSHAKRGVGEEGTAGKAPGGAEAHAGAGEEQEGGVPADEGI